MAFTDALFERYVCGRPDVRGGHERSCDLVERTVLQGVARVLR